VGYSGGKEEEQEREKKATGTAGSFFSFMRVMWIV
jgi:hypothetical protein